MAVVGKRWVDGRSTAFTLIEMLVSMVILLILMGIIFQVIQMSSQAWKATSQGTVTMQQTREAFERMTRNLSQATLNPYFDYIDSGGRWACNGNYSGTPFRRGRQSELQFISGQSVVSSTAVRLIPPGAGATQITHAVFFQAPLGVTTNRTTYGALNNLLNACGYFVVYCQDVFRPTFLNGFSNAPQNEYRYRLMEYIQPSDYFEVYNFDGCPAAPTVGNLDNGIAVPKWISGGLPTLTAAPPAAPNPVPVHPLANNIVALIIMPEQVANAAAGQVATTYINTPVNLAAPTASYNYDSGYHTATLNPAGIQNPTGNQLPPLVKVVMVAIDEPSATRLAAAYPSPTYNSTNPPDLGQLATSATPLFNDPTQLLTSSTVPEGDLEKFEDILAAKPGNLTGNKIKLNYFVFQTDVIIRSSKWSSQ
jgi:uncharacterized protein (TIGR02599 family)